jgi:hypothetical protein
MILGIGIGVVITSMMSMIYYAGTNPITNKEETYARAQKYEILQTDAFIQSDKKDDNTQGIVSNE